MLPSESSRNNVQAASKPTSLLPTPWANYPFWLKGQTWRRGLRGPGRRLGLLGQRIPGSWVRRVWERRVGAHILLNLWTPCAMGQGAAERGSERGVGLRVVLPSTITITTITTYYYQLRGCSSPGCPTGLSERSLSGEGERDIHNDD